MKLVIISLDYMFALPILGAALAVLFSSITGSQTYLLYQAMNGSSTLNAIVTSQNVVQRLDAGSNYSSAMRVLSQTSGAYLTTVAGSSACANLTNICRLVAINGTTYVLVVPYANAG